MKISVLIVEDEPAIQKLIQVFLKPYAVCDEALDGGEGLRKFVHHLEQKHPYDLVLLDIMMPVMDGEKVLEHIREMERQKGVDRMDGVKIIMLTAMDNTRDVICSFKIGCDAYLPKPFDETDLLQEIYDLKLLS